MSWASRRWPVRDVDPDPAPFDPGHTGEAVVTELDEFGYPITRRIRTYPDAAAQWDDRGWRENPPL